MKRRLFLTGAVALVAAPAAPAKALPATTTAETIAAVAAPLKALRPPWWGVSSRGEGWFNEAGHDLKSSIEIALGDGYVDVEIALCHPRDLHHPEYVEDIVLWLGDPAADCPLDERMQQSFEGANSDSDYEGEVVDASADSDWTLLSREIMPMIGEAFERNGIFIFGEIEEGCLEDCEHALLMLEADEVLKRDVKAAAERWSHDNGLLFEARTVDLSDSLRLDLDKIRTGETTLDAVLAQAERQQGRPVARSDR